MLSRCSSWMLLLLFVIPAYALDSRETCDAKQYEGKPGFTVKVGYGKTQEASIADALKDHSRTAPLLEAEFKDLSLIANGTNGSGLYVSKNTTLKAQYLRDVVIKSCLNQDVPRTDEQHIKSIVIIPDNGRIYYPLPESFTFARFKNLNKGYGLGIIHLEFSVDSPVEILPKDKICEKEWPNLYCAFGLTRESVSTVNGANGTGFRTWGNSESEIAGVFAKINSSNEVMPLKDISILIEAELAKREGLRKIEMGDDLPTTKPSSTPRPIQK